MKTQKKISRILRFDELAYNMNIFNYATDYLKVVTCNNSAIVSELQSKANFWVWWKNQYHIIDKLFLNIYKDKGLTAISRHELITLYKSMHVVMKAVPNALLYSIEAGYSKMLNQQIKNQ